MDNSELQNLELDPEMEPIECLDGPDGCEGPVEYRNPGYGMRSWPRCERHGERRVELEEENVRKYNPRGHTPPEGFDPLDAGERWDEDY